MRKIAIMIALCLAGIGTYAQDIDQKLLIGRWDLYALDRDSFYMCRDSMTQIVREYMRQDKLNDHSEEETTMDSTTTAGMVKSLIDNIFETYVVFKASGRTAMMDKTGNLTSSLQSGTYEWKAENRIALRLDNSPVATYVVVSLTATRLKLKGRHSVGELTFIRAK